MDSVLACYEDQEVIRLTGSELVSAVGEALERACCADDEDFDAEIPLSFYGTHKQSMGVRKYVLRLYEYLDCSDVAFTTALIYLDRIQASNKNNRLTPLNLHRLFATAVLVAIKYHDDEHFSNEYYAQVFGMKGLEEINQLEALFLSMVDFRVGVSEKEYYFYKMHLMQSQMEIPTHTSIEFCTSPVACSAA